MTEPPDQAAALEELDRLRQRKPETAGFSSDADNASPANVDGPDADELLLVRLDGRMSGRVTIGHTRLPVTTILEFLRAGDSPDLIAAAYPSVTAGQLRVLDQLRRELDEALL